MTPRLLSLLALVAGLAGCAGTARPPGFAELRAAPARPGHAAVYLYRHHAEPGRYDVALRLDNARVANLGEKTWTRLDPPAGRHLLRAVWPPLSAQLESRIELSVSAGEIRYIEVLGAQVARLQSRDLVGARVRIRTGSALLEADPDHASRLLAGCCALRPAVAPHTSRHR